MSVLDGVTQCWWLSKTCAIDWTAWSAVATGAAVVVALLVGALPIRLARDARRTQMRLLAKVVVDDLYIQEVHLRAAMLIPAANVESVDSWEYAECARCSSMVSPQTVADLIPYSEFLPKDVEAALARCIAMLAAARQRRVFVVPIQPGETCNLGGEIDWYKAVCVSLFALRVELSTWLNVELEDASENALLLGMALMGNAGVERDKWHRAQTTA
ncbi:TPA: hypothetical protein ACGCEE_004694 [Stenotrophomonas maltophilia]|uniref:hypothetical protein n=1 Tax=Stenotrophomonas maltophilia TaxID=40324 RepID=UPI0011B6433C|nr:hypothetical protein [Stenotrophomonas maltophilia]MCI1157067.1 hypothetical protein [Stenotrophomonas maltophilia]